MIAILAKLDGFRGDSRFTTWAYRFVVLEVANKLGRHFWLKPTVSLEAEEWERLPDRFGIDPLAQAQQHDLIAAVERAMAEDLTDHQRRFFVAVVVNAIPIEAVAARTGLNRGAIYKTVFDARRKIRAHLIANGHLDGEPTPACSTDRRTGVEDRDGVALARSLATR
jgi:RNA polymerase sigma-70 factor (ECF subfamily)